MILGNREHEKYIGGAGEKFFISIAILVGIR